MPTGESANSGYRLLPEYAAYDAQLYFPSVKGEARPRRGEKTSRAL